MKAGSWVRIWQVTFPCVPDLLQSGSLWVESCLGPKFDVDLLGVVRSELQFDSGPTDPPLGKSKSSKFFTDLKGVVRSDISKK